MAALAVPGGVANSAVLVGAGVDSGVAGVLAAPKRRAPILKWGDGGFIFPRSGRKTGVIAKIGPAKDAPTCRNRSVARGRAENELDGERAISSEPMERRANARVAMCAFPAVDHPQFKELTVATRDRSDRAHLVRREERIEDGPETGRVEIMLVNGEQLGPDQAKPRRYPPSQMTSRGVSFDSQFDELHRRQGELAGVAGIGRGSTSRASSAPLTARELLAEAAARAKATGKNLRSVIDGRIDGRSQRICTAEQLIAAWKAGRYRAGL